MTSSELSIALTERGLISDSQPLVIEPEQPANASPWYVQVVMGACAWFAGLLLFAFIILALGDFLFRGQGRWGALLILSVGACAGAAGLYAIAKNPFVNQFALAMSIAGQTGIAVALSESSGPRTALWGMLILEIVLIAVMRDRLHRVLSSLGAVIAWALAMHQAIFGDLPGANLVASSGTGPPYRYQGMLLWLLIWTPVVFAACWLVLREAQWMALGRDNVLRPVTHGLIAALSIAPLATQPDVFWFALGFGSGFAVVGGVALWPFMALVISLLALALAFELRSRPLMGLAILFALLEISSFYMVLGTTLLVKSLIMVSLGAILIAAARWFAVERK